MRALFAATAAFLILVPTARGQSPSPAPTAASATPVASGPPRDENLPAAEETAKAALERSPRHGEYVDVKAPDGTPIRTWVAYPERKDKAGVVIVIHEIFGLSDWVRAVADQLAREGFIAVAPDLISGHGPGRGGTDSVASRDDVTKLMRSTPPSSSTAPRRRRPIWPASRARCSVITEATTRG